MEERNVEPTKLNIRIGLNGVLLPHPSSSDAVTMMLQRSGE